MNDTGAGPPEPRELIAGLTFALLVLRPDLTIDQVNPAAESLIGRSARRSFAHAASRRRNGS